MAREKLRRTAGSGTKQAAEEQAKTSAKTGTLHLEPISGSIDRRSLAFEIELTRDDGVLVLGDIRLGAERAAEEEAFEIAHRIWTIVAEAANRVDNDTLGAKALAMADGALVQARDERALLAKSIDQSRAADPGRGRRPSGANRGVSYDYDELAADRAAGVSQAETARAHGCSPGTVARAVRYVAARDELLALTDKNLTQDIRDGLPVAELAARYETVPKVMRWVVSDFWDRRASGRSGSSTDS